MISTRDPPGTPDAVALRVLARKLLTLSSQEAGSPPDLRLLRPPGGECLPEWRGCSRSLLAYLSRSW